MGIKLRLFLTLGLSLFAFSSCVIPSKHTDIVRGNYSFFLGDYQGSIIRYLPTRTDAYSAYNLGNVYYMLAEHEHALDVWQRALEAAGDDKELRYRLWFNLGLVHYEQGNFEKALKAFSSAMLENPLAQEARINLELSYRNVQVQARHSGPSTGTVNTSRANLQEAQARLLEYVRRKEAGQWDEQNQNTTEIQSTDY